jgi:hypothetical protein
MRILFRLVALLTLTACLTTGSNVSAQTACSLSTLNGTYGFSASGLVPVPQEKGSVRFEPFAQVGLANFDGAGNVVVNVRVQTQGNINSAKYAGTYKIDATCAGTASFYDGSNNPTLRWEFVVVGSGSEIETLSLFPKTDTRPVFSTNFKQKKV